MDAIANWENIEKNQVYEGIVIQLQVVTTIPEAGQTGAGGFAIVRLIDPVIPRFVKLYFRPSEFRIAADAIARGVPVKFKGDCIAPNIGDYNAALVGNVAGFQIKE